MKPTDERTDRDQSTAAARVPKETSSAAFSDALQHHRAGRLARAEALCRQVLAADPQHADSLHLLGVIASRAGRHDLALTLVGEAIAIAPDNAAYHANLGTMLQAHGRQEEALAAWRRAGSLDPALPEAYDRLGRELQQQGRLDDAAAAYGYALRLRPDAPALHNSLGNLLYEQRKAEAAAACCRSAIALQPDYAEAHNNLGNALCLQHRLDEAVACYRRTLQLDPDCEAAHLNLGNVLRAQGRLDEAAACYRRAAGLDPGRAVTHYNLAVTLLDLGQPDEALACARAATSLLPEAAEAHVAMAVAHMRLAQPEAAIACCRAAIRLQPGDAEAHNTLALALLTTGNLAEGFPAYEYRWQVQPGIGIRRDFAQPQWRGEAAAGRTLLIHAEQGFGDTLQFCRYASLARARGLRVIMEAPLPLIRLLQGLAGIDGLVPTGEALPQVDLHCPMLSLPRALGTTLETIPGGTPYLHADRPAAAAWRQRLAPADGAGPRVGLAWAGSPRPDWPAGAEIDRRRSLPPEQLTPLLQVPGIQFFSLQKLGPPAPAEFRLIDHMDEMRDFADTAALIANLDLVVSVDTAVAHLAGALGKPVWMLDRFDHCWRWLAGRCDSPWYPSMRIYRQPRPGAWDAVLAELPHDLQAFARAWSTVGPRLPR